jgi:hypothetical protein
MLTHIGQAPRNPLKLKGRIARALLGEHKVWLLKEMTFTHMPSKAAKWLAKLSGLSWPPGVASLQTLFIHIPRTGGSSVSMGLYGTQVFMHHSAAYFKAIDPEVFSSSFKFTIVRNPWDRVVSVYHLLKAGGSDVVEVWNHDKYVELRDLSFDRFVADWLWPRKDCLTSLDVCLWPQTYFTHSRNGEILVDCICRWEDLETDMVLLKEKHGLDIMRLRINESINRISCDYRDYYQSHKTIQMISEIYSSDISAFGYKF